MPYINVDEVYILDNTGAQVDQVTDLPYTDAGLTESQQAQARANIAAGGTNPNLLDNPFFTINQRSASGAYTSQDVYVSDRWVKRGTGTCTVNNDNTLTLDDTSNYCQVREKIPAELAAYLIGKKVTLSVMESDGTITSTSYNITGASQYYTYVWNGSSYFSVDLRSGNNYVFVLVTGESRTIKAVKLELGTVSTLANDVPPNYAEELAKCQRYFIRLGNPTNKLNIGNGFIRDATRFFTVLHLPTSMRTTPTLSYSGTITVITTTNITGSGISLAYGYGNIIDLIITIPSSTAGAAGVAQLENGYIDLSADL